MDTLRIKRFHDVSSLFDRPIWIIFQTTVLRIFNCRTNQYVVKGFKQIGYEKLQKLHLKWPKVQSDLL